MPSVCSVLSLDFIRNDACGGGNADQPDGRDALPADLPGTEIDRRTAVMTRAVQSTVVCGKQLRRIIYPLLFLLAGVLDQRAHGVTAAEGKQADFCKGQKEIELYLPPMQIIRRISVQNR